ncbi:HD domain-containing phosphohydrolase [Paracidobacterium acidisoli]|uniref:Response regulator n=1 Tax=Paracidobacterium acidisoli TaxID=2303751 RepID=A0A372IP01_9BACT|nr:HD domain-containing phosphohydrolase [Paracidobacterium acidisoli]MBT9330976.1 response regulator [Paracidobacterium acidisoli]
MASERILVVDDEPYVRTVIAAMLEKSNYSPVLVSNGLEAVAHLEKDPPYDLVLSDIMMNGLDGIGLLERMRQIHPDTPMVLVTAIHDIGIAITAMRKGAYDYLLKPFEKEQLLATVRRALDYRRLVQQNAMYRQNLEQLVSARTEMLRQTMTDLERSYDITLEALGDALDLKDAETEGHSKRVTAYTIALARHMGVDSAQMRTVARGAFLHDIGKMAIPDAILLKPGKLDLNEQTVMREHCARGYQMLRKIPFLREAAEIVYSHQEHFDGSGYPRGLRDEQIPLGARIFAVADTLDAITSDRPYRRASTFEAAKREIIRCSGTQFDPRVVNVYVQLPDQLWEDLRSEISQHARFSPLSFTSGDNDEFRL